jgi:hypothetical protein
MPEFHACKSIAEFKKDAREILNKNNPVVISEKLIKI